MSQQITLNFRVIREFLVYTADFQEISTLEPNLTTKFVKFCGEIIVIKSATHNVSKKVFFIEIHPRRPKISSVECRKTCEIDKNPPREKNYWFYSILLVSWHSTEDIFGLRGWILIKNIFLETLWVALFMTIISLQNFTNFGVKFGFKFEICWKSANFCWDIYYFSERFGIVRLSNKL
jgi:hypothetical protein